MMITLKGIERRIGPLLKSQQSSRFNVPTEHRAYDNLGRTAAVLLIIHCKNLTPHVLLTRRSYNLKSHTGEISFPGGQYSSAQDLSLLDTALRETKEEVGLSFRPEEILGQLESVYTLTSNYSIVPFITIQKKIAAPKIFTNEVDCVIDAPLEETLATFQPDIEHYHISQQGVYKFTFQGTVIWGATARILKQLYDHLIK
jgi:8-oxo-dGTP pyrophosphatase MutT (NUDIX family)